MAQSQGQGHNKKTQSQGPTFRGQTLSKSRTGMLEAKAKNQGNNAQVFSKKKKKRKRCTGKNRKFSIFPRNFRCSQKKVFAQKIANFLWNFRRKKILDLGPFLTNQKLVLSSAEDRAFSRTWRLRGQGQGLDLWGPGQKPKNESSRTLSRPRTSLRTPPLFNTVYQTLDCC